MEYKPTKSCFKLLVNGGLSTARKQHSMIWKKIWSSLKKKKSLWLLSHPVNPEHSSLMG